MEEDACPLPGPGPNLPPPLLLPPHVQIEDDLVSVDDVVVLELLGTTLAEKHIATLLPKFVLVRFWQRLKSFVTDITGINTISILFLVPSTLIPSSKKINSLANPLSILAGPGASR